MRTINTFKNTTGEEVSEDFLNRLVEIGTGMQNPVWHKDELPEEGIKPEDLRIPEDKILLFLRKSGIYLQEWQEAELMGMLCTKESGVGYKHTTVGLIVGRQNGKTLIEIIRALIGVVMLGEKVIYTTHNNELATEVFEEMRRIIEASQYLSRRIPPENIRNNGKEGMIIKTRKNPKTKAQGVIYIMTRGASNSNPGRGKAADVVIYDEAHLVQDNHVKSLDAVMATRAWGQSIFCATPPDPEDEKIGGWFFDFRGRIRDEDSPITGAMWSEWTIDKVVNRYDIRYWYLTNPALNIPRKGVNGLTEDAMRASAGKLSDRDFSIERLGYMPTQDRSTLIEYGVWKDLRVSEWQRAQSATEKIAFAVKVNQTASLATVCVASADADRGTFIDCIYSSHNPKKWAHEIASILEAPLKRNKKVISVVIDGYGNIDPILEELSMRGLWKLKHDKNSDAYYQGKIEICNANIIGTSTSRLVAAVANRKVIHKDIDSGYLSRAVAVVSKRKIKGKPDLYGFASVDPMVDVSALEAAAIAYNKAFSAYATEYGKNSLESTVEYVRSRWNLLGGKR